MNGINPILGVEGESEQILWLRPTLSSPKVTKYSSGLCNTTISNFHLILTGRMC